MKNSSDTIENRTCDLPAFSAMPQPTVPLCAPAGRIGCLRIPVQEGEYDEFG